MSSRQKAEQGAARNSVYTAETQNTSSTYRWHGRHRDDLQKLQVHTPWTRHCIGCPARMGRSYCGKRQTNVTAGCEWSQSLLDTINTLEKSQIFDLSIFRHVDTVSIVGEMVFVIPSTVARNVVRTVGGSENRRSISNSKITGWTYHVLFPVQFCFF